MIGRPPQRLLIFAEFERGVGVVDLTVRSPVVLGAVHQILVQGLAVDRYAFGARCGDRGDAGLGRGVHHVEGRTLDVGGEPDHPVKGQVLRERVVHLGHVLEADPVLAGQFFVHVHDDVVVLGVDRGDATGLCQDLEHLPDVAEIDHAALAAGGDVGREHLDRGVPLLHRLGQFAEALGRDLAEQHCVKSVVAMAGAGPLPLPAFDRLLDRLAALDRGKVDRCRRAAVQGRKADPRGRLGQHRLGDARHRPAAMDMRVDAARNDDLPGGVDHPRRADRGEAAGRADRDDMLAGDANIGRLGTGGKDGKAA